jgi:hypothetical protein
MEKETVCMHDNILIFHLILAFLENNYSFLLSKILLREYISD